MRFHEEWMTKVKQVEGFVKITRLCCFIVTLHKQLMSKLGVFSSAQVRLVPD